MLEIYVYVALMVVMKRHVTNVGVNSRSKITEIILNESTWFYSVVGS